MKKLTTTITCEAEVESEDELDDLSYQLSREVSSALDDMSAILDRDEVKELYSDGVSITSDDEADDSLTDEEWDVMGTACAKAVQQELLGESAPARFISIPRAKAAEQIPGLEETIAKAVALLRAGPEPANVAQVAMAMLDERQQADLLELALDQTHVTAPERVPLKQANE